MVRCPIDVDGTIPGLIRRTSSKAVQASVRVDDAARWIVATRKGRESRIKHGARFSGRGFATAATVRPAALRRPFRAPL